MTKKPTHTPGKWKAVFQKQPLGRDHWAVETVDAWHNVKKQCHEIALSHGLPEITGFYGLSETGEFVEN